MGQYQQEILDLKGCNLELAHRNSQVSIPFCLSDKGYGFLWHNASVGAVHFGRNTTQWEAENTRGLDYWITAGDSPRQILHTYTRMTGRPPMMPEYGLGFWQCKLRYYHRGSTSAGASRWTCWSSTISTGLAAATSASTPSTSPTRPRCCGS